MSRLRGTSPLPHGHVGSGSPIPVRVSVHVPVFRPRPSTDGLNKSKFGTVILCPITTTERAEFVWRPGVLPGDLRIADATSRAEPHWVETDQIVTIDRSHRLIRHLATLENAEKMAAVDHWLRRLILPVG